MQVPFRDIQCHFVPDSAVDRQVLTLLFAGASRQAVFVCELYEGSPQEFRSLSKREFMSKEKSEFNKGQELLEGLAETAQAAPIESEEAMAVATPMDAAADQGSDVAVDSGDAQASPSSPGDPSAASRYLQRVKELGFENVSSEDEAIDRLIDSYQRTQQHFQQVQQAYQQAQPYVQYGQQYLQQLQNPAFQQFQNQSQQPAAEQQQDPREWWNPPQYDPMMVDKYREIVIDPATGARSLEWKANTPAEVRASVEAHQAYRERWAEELVNNPQRALQPFKEEVLNDMRQELQYMFGSTEQQREVNNFAQRIKEENADWMFEQDPRTGRVALDPVSGQPVWSQQGQMAAHYIEEAESIGISDPYKQWNYAILNLQNLYAQQMQYAQPQTMQSAPPPATVEQVAEQKKQELLTRGRSVPGTNSIPSRAGSVPPPDADMKRGRSQNKNSSAGQKILSDLKRAGVGVG